MSDQVDKRNYDVASISHAGQENRTNHVRHALYFDKSKIKVAGEFVKVFADMFLKREAGSKSII